MTGNLPAARERHLESAEAYKKAEVDYLDGITVDLGDWWFNVRKSNTEPLLRLNLEANSPKLIEEKMREMKKMLAQTAVRMGMMNRGFIEFSCLS